MPGRMGRFAFQALVVSAIVYAGGACTALYLGDTDDTSSPPGPAIAEAGHEEDARVDTGETVIDAGDASADATNGVVTVCPNARFVDPFTDVDLITPFWSKKVVTGVATLTTAEAGASSPGSLRPSAQDAGGGVAYLELVRGEIPATFSFCLSFALKLLSPPDRALFGPRLVSNTGQTNSSIAIELVGYNVSIVFFNDGCPDGGADCKRDERTPVGTIIGDQWTTITLVGELGSSSATVTTRVGEAAPRTHAVTVPMHGFQTSSLHVGISTLLNTKNVDLLIDDLRYDDTLAP